MKLVGSHALSSTDLRLKNEMHVWLVTFFTHASLSTRGKRLLEVPKAYRTLRSDQLQPVSRELGGTRGPVYLQVPQPTGGSAAGAGGRQVDYVKVFTPR